MAGSDEDDDRKTQSGPADGLREAVERTFRDAAGNMAGAGTRAQALLDDAAAAIARLGAVAQQGEQTAAVERLTEQVEALTARVEALEGGAPAAKPKPKAKSKAKAKAKPRPKVKAGLDARAVAERDGGGPKNPVAKPDEAK